MAMLNLSLVTETLGNLIRKYVTKSDQWTQGQLKVSYQPPDKLKGDRVIGLYLYHATENGHYQNAPPPQNVRDPIRFTPMGLDLHYQLTAQSTIGGADSEDSVLLEQRMMGLAMKVLRDYPVIDDSTVLHGADPDDAGNLILVSGLRGSGNQLRIELLKVDHTQAISYWTAGSSPLRWAAYYRVSVVLLEPYTVPQRAGRVLTIGPYVTTTTAPRLFKCRNRLSFPIPDGRLPQQVDISPAQVPVGDLEEANRQVIFEGMGLTGGQIELCLRHGDWKEPIPVDKTWNQMVTETEIRITLQDTVTPPEGTAQTILPGMYSAFVRRTTAHVLSDGTTRHIEHNSNDVPFMVLPYIKSISTLPADGPDNIVTVESEAFSKVGPEAIKVYVADEPLQYRSSLGKPAKGQYDIKGVPKQLRLRLSDTLVASWNAMTRKSLPFRLLVNGCESPPRWIEPA
jgi:hypothetical protein